MFSRCRLNVKWPQVSDNVDESSSHLVLVMHSFSQNTQRIKMCKKEDFSIHIYIYIYMSIHVSINF